MKYKDFKKIESIVADETLQRLERTPVPTFVTRRTFGIFSRRIAIPKNLGEIPLGAFLLASSQNDVYSLFNLFLKIGRKEDVDALSAANVLAILAFFKREILRLTKDLNETTPPQTQEEREAAQGLTNVGLFGLIDVISQRQHISTEEAAHLPISLVLQFLKIDKNKVLFQKNLNNIYKSKKI